MKKWISIGPTCIPALTLRSMDSRTEAYPFDWAFSDLVMVQNCIEQEFEQFLNKAFIKKIADGVSTNVLYGKGVFNHHDLTDPETYESYVRRCKRFMEEYKSGAMLLFMMKMEECDRYIADLPEFANFVQKTSPDSKIVVIRVCKTNQYYHTLDKRDNNVVMYSVYYGDLDNMKSFEQIFQENCVN